MNTLIQQRNNFENELYDILIEQRNNFENELYDILTNNSIDNIFVYYEIPPSFWESVKITYDVKTLEDIIGKDECIICSENHLNFKKLHCCNQKMCNGCCYKWFNESIKCPYCYQDIREFNLKNSA